MGADFSHEGMAEGCIVRAAQDDLLTLKSRALWACDPVALQRHRRHAKIDLPAVIMAMRQETNLRGLPIQVDPQDAGAEP